MNVKSKDFNSFRLCGHTILKSICSKRYLNELLNLFHEIIDKYLAKFSHEIILSFHYLLWLIFFYYCIQKISSENSIFLRNKFYCSNNCCNEFLNRPKTSAVHLSVFELNSLSCEFKLSD